MAGDDNRPPEPPARWNPEEANGTPDSGVTPDSGPDSGPGQEPSEEPPGNQEATVMGGIGKTRFQLKGPEVAEFKNARNYIMAAQIVAIVSLFFGGTLFSIVALVCAFIGNSKLENIAATRVGEPEVQKALRRSGRIIIAVAACALVLNIIAAIFLYPLVMEAIQNGDLGSLFNSSATSGSGTGSGSGNTTWG